MAFVRKHQACPDCGSSDALCINEDNSTYCFSCQKLTKTPSHEGVFISTPVKKAPPMSLKAYEEGISVSVSERRITKSTMEKYGVVRHDNNYHFPYYNKDTTLVASKVREVEDKKFHTEGTWTEATLFGQNLFPSGGKYVTIVEGEFDALGAYQAMGSKWPVVSIRNGVAGALKDCQQEYEYLMSFESIVICFDNDDPGRKAAKQVAELFGNKAKVFKHVPEHKDACDYVADSKEAVFVDRWWKAESFVPDGIVAGSTLWDLVSEPTSPADALYPWQGLNEITYGIRFGELVTITAGSGLGKSQLLREIVWHVLQNSEDNIGLMFMEESVKKTALSLMSLAANAPLHLPDVEVVEEERKRAFDATLGTNRVFLFDHFGSTAIENVINRVRYMAKAMNCRYIVLDHLSIIVSSQDNGDERKAIDEIMTKLRTLVQETNIALFVVSHLKRPEGRGHEEGAATSLAQLRGSASIAQLSDIVLGAERNGQADDLIERNTTHVRVLKNRFSGITGPACSLLYSKETGRMIEQAEIDESEVL
jgi:twinkle protein